MSTNNTLKLNYLLWHEHSLPPVYATYVSYDQSISDLIHNILETPEAHKYKAHGILLFKCSAIPRIPRAALKDAIKNWSPSDDDMISPADEVSECFPDIPSKGHVHFIVISQTLTLNYVFVGSDDMGPSPIEISRNGNVEMLKNMINAKEKLSTNANALQLWRLGESIDINDTETRQKLLQEWPNPNTPSHLTASQCLDDIFPIVISRNVIHIIVKAPSPPQKTKNKTITASDKRLIPLMVYRNSTTWTMQDVKLPQNKLTLAPIGTQNCDLPLQTVNLMNILSRTRQAPLLATQKVILRSLTPELFRRFYGSEMYESHQNTGTSEEEECEEDPEVFAFMHLSQIYKRIKESISSRNSSSSLKEAAFCSVFTIPTLLLALLSDGVTYKQDQSWLHPILVYVLRRNGGSDEYKYLFRNDFSLILGDIIPFVVGEVVSDADAESDRNRMLLQAAVAARIAAYLLKDSSETFVVMAIYVTKDLVAERYLVTQMGSDMHVHIAQRNFNLLDMKEAVDLLLSLYNYREYVLQKKDSFDHSKGKDFHTTAQIYTKNIPSLSTHRARTVGKTDTSTPRDLNSVREERESPFDSRHVRHHLEKMACEYLYSYAPNVACVLHKPTDSKVVLKYIPPHNLEADILDHLSQLKSDNNENHTIQPVSIWNIFGEKFVSMPAAGYALDRTPPVLDYPLLSIAQQLVNGVEFMHQHGVAHLDLKPNNVLVDPEGYLSIIDFSVSEWVRGVESMTEGFVGTKGYTAPEIGRGQFSPILADVWACGHLVNLICKRHEAFKCEPWVRETVLQIGAKLMHPDPRQRLRLSDALTRLREAAASKGDSSPTPTRYIPPWSTVIPYLVMAS